MTRPPCRRPEFDAVTGRHQPGTLKQIAGGTIVFAVAGHKPVGYQTANRNEDRDSRSLPRTPPQQERRRQDSCHCSQHDNNPARSRTGETKESKSCRNYVTTAGEWKKELEDGVRYVVGDIVDEGQ